MKKMKLFSDKEFYSRLWNLALPIALQNLMLALVAAADALMLGRVDQNAMSAVSLATQVQFIQNMVLGSIVSGIVVLGAQYWGKGDKKTINDLFCLGLRLAGVVSLLFFIGCVFFPRYLMLIFTDEEVLIQIGIRYLQIAGWSYLLTGISQCYLAIMKVTDHAAQAARVSTGAVLCNIVLNAVFIYGLLGLPAMHERGAALATLISRVLELGWVVLCSYRKDYIHPQWKRLFHREGWLEKASMEELEENNRKMYGDILPEHYEESYGNPDYAQKILGRDFGQLLSFLYTEVRGMIVFAYEDRLFDMTVAMELFVQIYNLFEDPEVSSKDVKDAIYWYVSDYSDEMAGHRVREGVDPSLDFAVRIICESDLTDLRYLYKYGEYVTENERAMAAFLNTLTEEEIQAMARTYTEGYRIGFIQGRKDITKKKTVNIRFQLGFERMVKAAIEQFREM